jgi:hypothetical protein
MPQHRRDSHSAASSRQSGLSKSWEHRSRRSMSHPTSRLLTSPCGAPREASSFTSRRTIHSVQTPKCARRCIWQTRIETQTRMSCTHDAFLLRATLRACGRGIWRFVVASGIAVFHELRIALRRHLRPRRAGRVRQRRCVLPDARRAGTLARADRHRPLRRCGARPLGRAAARNHLRTGRAIRFHHFRYRTRGSSLDHLP